MPHVVTNKEKSIIHNDNNGYQILNNMDFLNFQGDNIFAGNSDDEYHNFLGMCFGGKNCLERKATRQDNRELKNEGKAADNALTNATAGALGSTTPTDTGGDNTLLYVGLAVGTVILGGTIFFILAHKTAPTG